MPAFSKLATAAVLASGAAAQASVYISPGTASFVPGTFGTTSSDGSYISAGVAQPAGGFGGFGGFGGSTGGSNYDDISYAAQNGGPAANVGIGGYGSYGAGYPGGLGVGVGLGLGINNGAFPGPSGYDAGFQGGYSGGYSGSGFGQPQGSGLTPPPPPIYQAGTGVSGGNLGQPNGQGLGPPPPPIYQAGIGVSGGNLPGGPTVQVGVPIHTGGFKKVHKRDVKSTKQYPYGYGAYSGYGGYGSYGAYSGYRGYSPYGGYGGLYGAYSGPTVTIGAPTASFVPGTFGTTFSDGGYTSWGTPVKRSLNKRQTISASAGYYGPTVTIGAPTALFVPGTFGTTFSDGGYTSWGVAQPQVPAYGAAYGSGYYKREVSTESAQSIDKATVDGSRSDNRPLRNGYRKSGYDSDWSQSARKPSPNSIIQHNNGYESRNPFY